MKKSVSSLSERLGCSLCPEYLQCHHTSFDEGAPSQPSKSIITAEPDPDTPTLPQNATEKSPNGDSLVDHTVGPGITYQKHHNAYVLPTVLRQTHPKNAKPTSRCVDKVSRQGDRQKKDWKRKSAKSSKQSRDSQPSGFTEQESPRSIPTSEREATTSGGSSVDSLTPQKSCKDKASSRRRVPASEPFTVNKGAEGEVNEVGGGSYFEEPTRASRKSRKVKGPRAVRTGSLRTETRPMDTSPQPTATAHHSGDRKPFARARFTALCNFCNAPLEDEHKCMSKKMKGEEPFVPYYYNAEECREARYEETTPCILGDLDKPMLERYRAEFSSKVRGRGGPHFDCLDTCLGEQRQGLGSPVKTTLCQVHSFQRKHRTRGQRDPDRSQSPKYFEETGSSKCSEEEARPRGHLSRRETCGRHSPSRIRNLRDPSYWGRRAPTAYDLRRKPYSFRPSGAQTVLYEPEGWQVNDRPYYEEASPACYYTAEETFARTIRNTKQGPEYSRLPCERRPRSRRPDEEDAIEPERLPPLDFGAFETRAYRDEWQPRLPNRPVAARHQAPESAVRWRRTTTWMEEPGCFRGLLVPPDVLREPEVPLTVFSEPKEPPRFFREQGVSSGTAWKPKQFERGRRSSVLEMIRKRCAVKGGRHTDSMVSQSVISRSEEKIYVGCTEPGSWHSLQAPPRVSSVDVNRRWGRTQSLETSWQPRERPRSEEVQQHTALRELTWSTHRKGSETRGFSSSFINLQDPIRTPANCSQNKKPRDVGVLQVEQRRDQNMKVKTNKNAVNVGMTKAIIDAYNPPNSTVPKADGAVIKTRKKSKAISDVNLAIQATGNNLGSISSAISLSGANLEATKVPTVKEFKPTLKQTSKPTARPIAKDTDRPSFLSKLFSKFSLKSKLKQKLSDSLLTNGSPDSATEKSNWRLEQNLHPEKGSPKRDFKAACASAPRTDSTTGRKEQPKIFDLMQQSGAAQGKGRSANLDSVAKPLPALSVPAKSVCKTRPKKKQTKKDSIINEQKVTLFEIGVSKLGYSGETGLLSRQRERLSRGGAQKILKDENRKGTEKDQIPSTSSKTLSEQAQLMHSQLSSTPPKHLGSKKTAMQNLLPQTNATKNTQNADAGQPETSFDNDSAKFAGTWDSHTFEEMETTTNIKDGETLHAALPETAKPIPAPFKKYMVVIPETQNLGKLKGPQGDTREEHLSQEDEGRDKAQPQNLPSGPSDVPCYDLEQTEIETGVKKTSALQSSLDTRSTEAESQAILDIPIAEARAPMVAPIYSEPLSGLVEEGLVIFQEVGNYQSKVQCNPAPLKSTARMHNNSELAPEKGFVTEKMFNLEKSRTQPGEATGRRVEKEKNVPPREGITQYSSFLLHKSVVAGKRKLHKGTVEDEVVGEELESVEGIIVDKDKVSDEEVVNLEHKKTERAMEQCLKVEDLDNISFYAVKNFLEVEDLLNEMYESELNLYPESQLVIIITLMCFIWICAVILLSSHHQGDEKPSSFPEWITSGTSRRATSPTDAKFSPNLYICSTEYCQKEGMYLNSLFSKDVSPCDNFYQYVCHSWNNNFHVLPEGSGIAVSRDTLLEQGIAHKVLENLLNSHNYDLLQARQLYEVCTHRPKDSSVIALREIFKSWPQKTWPITNSTSALDMSRVWLTAGILMREFGVEAFVGVSVGEHGDSNKLTVELDLPKSLYFKGDNMYPNIALVFRAAIRETAVEFGGDDSIDQLTPEIMSVFTGLAQRYPTSINAEAQETTFDSLREGLRTFLSTVFEGDIPMKRNIIVRNPQFILVELDTLLKNSSATALLNYLGFRLIISVAAFLPEHMLNLQMLLSIEATGRVLTSNMSSVLCLLAVERVLPTCLVKAYAKDKVESGADLRSRVWLSQLESSFGRNARRLLWMDQLTYDFVLRKMQSHRLYRFFSPILLATNSCAGSITKFGDSALVIYYEASKRFQQARLHRLNDGTKFRHPGFVFDTRSRFIAAQHQVYVPLGLVNDSVPTNGTMFAFHLSRVAVRLFGSLVQLVNQYQDEDFTDHSQRTLDELLDCLARDWRALPSSFDAESKDVVPDADQARYAILTQTAALRLAFVAFQELLHVERIWRVSFRLRPLRDTTSEQLFFLYYALDNCEHSDAPFKAHEYLAQRRLPAELRVNFPLRHMPEFSEAFGCGQGAALRLPQNAVCSVFNLSVPSLH